MKTRRLCGKLLFSLFCLLLAGYAVHAQDTATSAAPGDHVDLRSEILRRGIDVGDQGPARPTCSVFAMTFLLEWAFTAPQDASGPKCRSLSVEYLNHMANVATGRDDDGDFFESIDRGFREYGVVPENALPYDRSRTYNFSTMVLPSSLIEEGKRFAKDLPPVKGRFIKEWSKAKPGLTDAQFNEVLDCLRRGIPVAIGRDHSMVAVGFDLDASQAGGGRVILRDSRGKETGDKGYCMESFKNVKETTFDAFVYEKSRP